MVRPVTMASHRRLVVDNPVPWTQRPTPRQRRNSGTFRRPAELQVMSVSFTIVVGAVQRLGGSCRRHTARNGFCRDLRASRWITLGSSHYKCSLNRQLRVCSMTTTQHLSPKTRYRSKFSILTGEGRASLHGDRDRAPMDEMQACTVEGGH
jgi:hypothetical protein